MAKIKVLLIDDSNIVHILLEKIITLQEDIVLAGNAYNGIEGIKMVKELSPDVVVMDINMPQMDGLEAIQEIMHEKPTPIIVFSSASKDIVDLSFKSIELGAVDIIEKPFSKDFEALRQKIEQKLIQTIRTFADFRVIRRIKKTKMADPHSTGIIEKNIQKHETQQQPAKNQGATTYDKNIFKPVHPVPAAGEFPVITIAASTGGPQTVRRLLENTTFKNIPAGIVIVQHMSDGFMEGFCDWLKLYSVIPVSMPERKGYMEPGHVYVAPGGYHLGFDEKGRFEFHDSPPIYGIRPSASLLFKYAALAFKNRLIAIVLTGMGNDGTEGLVTVRENNGFAIAQDEESSILFGMPKSAIEAGLADIILPLTEIPGFLYKFCDERFPND